MDAETREALERVREAMREGRYRSMLSGPTDHEDQWWHERQEALSRIEQTLRDLSERTSRAEHIIECADTPLMRDVLRERDALAEQVESFIEAGHGIDHNLFEMVCAERDALAERLEQAERAGVTTLSLMESQKARAEKAERENEQFLSGRNLISHESHLHTVKALVAERKAAEAEAARLREVLEKYANIDGWNAVKSPETGSAWEKLWGHPVPWIDARAALDEALTPQAGGER